jgi:hypothetical protein
MTKQIWYLSITLSTDDDFTEDEAMDYFGDQLGEIQRDLYSHSPAIANVELTKE